MNGARAESTSEQGWGKDGDMRVAVSDLHRSDGFGPNERTWSTLAIGYGSTERAAIECAETWFNETDQSDDCDVTFSVEQAGGTIVQHRVVIETKPRARLKREGER